MLSTLLFTSMPTVLFAQGVRFDALGFEGGIITQSRVTVAPQLAASVRLLFATVPAEISVGSSVADLSDHEGTQSDVFLTAARLWEPARNVTLGAGIGIHSLHTRIVGAAAEEQLVVSGRDRSGLRPALTGSLGFAVPLAHGSAARLQLVARGTAMSDAQQLSLALGMQLAPRARGVLLGEAVRPHMPRADEARSWDALISQIMLFESAARVHDIMATHMTLQIKFSGIADDEVLTAISRVARVFAASAEPLQLAITAAEPAPVALAATAAGFPPERITLIAGEQHVILQVTRPVPTTAIRAGPSSPRQ